MSLFPGQLHRRRTRGRNAQRFAQLLTVARDDCDFTSATGSAYIEQFLFHGIGGQDDTVHRFPLAAMRGDGVAVFELVIISRQCATILKLNASPLDTTHRHKLAIRGAKTGISTIGSKHETVARSNVDGLPLMDGEGARLCWCKAPVFTARVASDQRARVNAADSEGLVFLHTPCCPMHYQHLPLTVVRQITFLRVRPLQRDVSIHRDAMAEMTALRKVIANRTSDTTNLLMRGRDYQNTPGRISGHLPVENRNRTTRPKPASGRSDIASLDPARCRHSLHRRTWPGTCRPLRRCCRRMVYGGEGPESC
jgi:hypothetical protein